MTSRNGYFPGKHSRRRQRDHHAAHRPGNTDCGHAAPVTRSAPGARQDATAARRRRWLVEGADRIMRTPTEHQAAGVAFKVARIYLRASAPTSRT